jgi:hypothetical protein
LRGWLPGRVVAQRLQRAPLLAGQVGVDVHPPRDLGREQQPRPARACTKVSPSARRITRITAWRVLSVGRNHSS